MCCSSSFRMHNLIIKEFKIKFPDYEMCSDEVKAKNKQNSVKGSKASKLAFERKAEEFKKLGKKIMYKDKNGRILNAGVLVRWTGVIPNSLLKNLPISDQQAIQQAKGMTVEGSDEFGNIELGFQDQFGGMHWIWVKSEFVEAK